MTKTIQSPEWTPDDRSLLLGLAAYEATLCPGCGFPKAIAWHSWTHEAWTAPAAVCHACTAAADGEERSYRLTRHSLDEDDIVGLPLFEWGQTTTEPTPKSD